MMHDWNVACVEHVLKQRLIAIRQISRHVDANEIRVVQLGHNR
jgi:hypothetical protein